MNLRGLFCRSALIAHSCGGLDDGDDQLGSRISGLSIVSCGARSTMFWAITHLTSFFAVNTKGFLSALDIELFVLFVCEFNANVRRPNFRVR